MSHSVCLSHIQKQKRPREMPTKEMIKLEGWDQRSGTDQPTRRALDNARCVANPSEGLMKCQGADGDEAFWLLMWCESIESPYAQNMHSYLLSIAFGVWR
jgi:hypothetical protein